MKPKGSSEEIHLIPFTSYVIESYVTSHVRESPRTFQKSSHTHPGTAELDTVVKHHDVKKLKRFLRSNNWPVDHEIRRTLWQKVCGRVHGSQQKDFDTYAEMVKDILGDDSEDHAPPLPLFVDSARLEHYGLTTDGTRVARRVLCVVSHERPDIVYCPSLYPLVSLMLHYMSERDCHDYVIRMIRSKERYFAQTRSASEAWPLVLHDLAKKYASGSYKYISKLGFTVESVLQDWIWWILLNLPFNYLVRIVDIYLLEGLKFLYRVALSILIHFRKSVGQMDVKTTSDFSRKIEDFCSNIPVPVEKLLKVAFEFRGLSRTEIWKLTTKKEIYVQSKHNVAMLQSTVPTSPSAGSLNSVFVKGNANSYMMKTGEWRDLYSWMPKRVTLKQPKLLFSTAEHGTSLATFYSHVEGHEPTFLAIKTRKGEIIGAYCSVDWAERRNPHRRLAYFGTGESFVCRFIPSPGMKYSWVGLVLGEKTPNSAHMFMCGDSTQISIGGGGGVAILLDENLLRGRSDRCDTYDNQPLTENGEFDVTILEAFAFE